MRQLQNKNIAINIDDESGQVVLTDKLRGVDWRLDGNGNKFLYNLHDGYIEIKYIYSGDESVKSVTMPSAFSPSGSAKKFLFPIMQGMLWDTADKTYTEPFESYRGEGGHHGFSMPMFAILSNKGGLLYIAETQDDCHWIISRRPGNKTRCDNIQTASAGTMRYTRKARIYFTGPSITQAAKCYRAAVKEKGRFITFKQKAEKYPALKNLFGALMCYVGYCRDDIDYAANLKKLKAYGFDRALVYPVRFNTYSQDFKMGGADPINLSDAQIAAIKDVGYDVAPWTWINEAIDDGGEYINNMYRHDSAGNKKVNWQIDDFKWHSVCSAFMEEYYLSQKKDRMRDMTWDHFDVIACAANGECHAKVGMLEMTDFEFLTENHNLQRTVFEDGTAIYANFGLNTLYHRDCGPLAPQSWKSSE